MKVLEIKHTAVCLVLMAVCLIAMLGHDVKFGMDIQKQDPGPTGLMENSDNYFQTVSIYQIKELKPSMAMDASELIYNNTGRYIFFGPKGHTFTSDGRPIFYQGNKGLFLQDQNILNLEDNVVILLEKHRMEADKVTYEVNKEFAIGVGNVRSEAQDTKTGDVLKINSDQVEVWNLKNHAKYSGNVAGRIIRKKVYEESIHFWSDFLNAYMDESRIFMEGNVKIKKQQLTAKSLSGEIFLENYNKKLKYYVLYDDVRVTEKVQAEGGVLVRRAFSEKLEGIMSEDLIILTGNPKVLQETDVIKGNKITLRQNSEVVEVDDANTNFLLK